MQTVLPIDFRGGIFLIKIKLLNFQPSNERSKNMEITRFLVYLHFQDHHRRKFTLIGAETSFFIYILRSTQPMLIIQLKGGRNFLTVVRGDLLLLQWIPAYTFYMYVRVVGLNYFWKNLDINSSHSNPTAIHSNIECAAYKLI